MVDPPVGPGCTVREIDMVRAEETSALDSCTRDLSFERL